MLNNILVTLDGSALAEKSLEYARAITSRGATITLLSVLDLPNSRTYALYDVPMAIPQYDEEAYLEQARKNTQQYLDDIADNLRRAGYNVQTLIELGDPASVIVDEAEKLKVDALIISTHGRSGLGRWLFGSVTQKVLGGLPCPVFVVPGRKVDRSTDEVNAVSQKA